jgi:chemotaxis protein MotB
MSMGDDKIVIVVKKAKKHKGHHGGSWKVAYADFVTAMMAFFMVMWIVGMESDVKDLVEGYFNNPVGFRQAFGAGLDPVSRGSTPVPSPLENMPVFVRAVEARRFNAVRDQILRDLEGVAGSEDFGSQVEVIVTPDGLRIELREGPSGETFFTFGSDDVKPAAREALSVISANVSGLPNPVVIEGHTDSATYPSVDYTNWELSVDRANAARRILVEFGMRADRVKEVRGHADRDLLVPDDPLNPSNRRVTILIPYLVPVDTGDEVPDAGAMIGGGSIP